MLPPQEKQQILQGLVNTLAVLNQETDEYNDIIGELFLILFQLKEKWLTK